MSLLLPLILLALLAALASGGGYDSNGWPVVRPDRLKGWPKGWNPVPDGYWQAVAKWAEQYKVPSYIVVLVTRAESNFVPRLDHQQSAAGRASYRKNEYRKIPNSDQVWGDFYAVNDWHAYGLMGLMPFAYVGVDSRHGGDPAGAALTNLFDVDRNVHLGCYWLAYWHARYGTWQKALRAYATGNPMGGDRYWQKFLRFMGELRPYLKIGNA